MPETQTKINEVIGVLGKSAVISCSILSRSGESREVFVSKNNHLFIIMTLISFFRT